MRSGTHQRIGTLCLAVLLLVGLSLPRFGLVWHDHEDPDEDHPDYQLLGLLGSSHASHPDHHSHRPTDTSHVSLIAADMVNVHGHYVDASLLVFFCLCHPLTLTLLRMSLHRHHRRVLFTRHIAPLLARAPPTPLLLIPSFFATRVCSLSSAL